MQPTTTSADAPNILGGRAVHIPVSRIAWQLVNAAHGACSIRAQGYNSTEAMDATTHGFHGLVDPIGFMLVSTSAHCPQYAYMYSGLCPSRRQGPRHSSVEEDDRVPHGGLDYPTEDEATSSGADRVGRETFLFRQCDHCTNDGGDAEYGWQRSGYGDTP